MMFTPVYYAHRNGEKTEKRKSGKAEKRKSGKFKPLGLLNHRQDTGDADAGESRKPENPKVPVETSE